jgi:hypothetical protein
MTPPIRQTLIVSAAIIGTAAGCGGHGQHDRTITVNAGVRKTFPSGALRPGDTVKCRAGGGSAVVPKSGGVASSQGLRIIVLGNGRARVSCPSVTATGTGGA